MPLQKILTMFQGTCGMRGLLALLPLLCLLVLPATAPRAASLPPSVTPPKGWKEVKDPVELERIFADTPVVRRESSRIYARADGALCLMVTSGIPAEDFSREHEGYRRLGKGFMTDDIMTKDMELIAPARKGGDGGRFVLFGPPSSVFRLGEVAPMLAAYAKLYDIPRELTTPPADVSRYAGKFAPRASGRQDEYGWTAYSRSFGKGGRSQIELLIIPYAEAWMPKKNFLALVWAGFLNQWGELTPEGKHWQAGRVSRLAFSRDGKAACVLMAMTGYPDAECERELRRAMRDLPDFVW